MLENPFRLRKRSNIPTPPFPDVWFGYLRNNVHVFERLSARERTKLCGCLPIFVAEKNWEGCGGLAMTDEIKVTIAAQACVLTLGWEDVYFDEVRSILVYPTAYRARGRVLIGTGTVVESESARIGEATYRGAVVLAWPDVLNGGRRRTPGRNVVYHEFAHQLDMMNGRVVDGTPLFASEELYDRWQQVFGQEYKRLVDDARCGRETLLDGYGATNVGEFFAVATECFFGWPVQMAAWHPELYAVMSDFFRQCPAAREVQRCVPDGIATNHGHRPGTGRDRDDGS